MQSNDDAIEWKSTAPAGLAVTDWPPAQYSTSHSASASDYPLEKQELLRTLGNSSTRPSKDRPCGINSPLRFQPHLMPPC